MATPSKAPERQDYFAVFSLPRKLWIEMPGLEQKFLQLSWKLHPDNFVNASVEEQADSLKRSSALNDAYRVLRDPVARVEYLLEIEGARKEGEQKQQAPPELLEEVFELNESLDELREANQSGADLESLKSNSKSPKPTSSKSCSKSINNSSPPQNSGTLPSTQTRPTQIVMRSKYA